MYIVYIFIMYNVYIFLTPKRGQIPNMISSLWVPWRRRLDPYPYVWYSYKSSFSWLKSTKKSCKDFMVKVKSNKQQLL